MLAPAHHNHNQHHNPHPHPHHNHNLSHSHNPNMKLLTSPQPPQPPPSASSQQTPISSSQHPIIKSSSTNINHHNSNRATIIFDKPIQSTDPPTSNVTTSSSPHHHGATNTPPTPASSPPLHLFMRAATTVQPPTTSAHIPYSRATVPPPSLPPHAPLPTTTTATATSTSSPPGIVKSESDAMSTDPIVGAPLPYRSSVYPNHPRLSSMPSMPSGTTVNAGVDSYSRYRNSSATAGGVAVNVGVGTTPSLQLPRVRGRDDNVTTANAGGSPWAQSTWFPMNDVDNSALPQTHAHAHINSLHHPHPGGTSPGGVGGGSAVPDLHVGMSSGTTVSADYPTGRVRNRAKISSLSDQEKRKRHNEHTKSSRQRIDHGLERLKGILRKARPHLKLNKKADIVDAAFQFVADTIGASVSPTTHHLGNLPHHHHNQLPHIHHTLPHPHSHSQNHEPHDSSLSA